jgi:hypothetical protein
MILLQLGFIGFYYESRKRELKTRPIYECRCDERLKTKNEKSTRLTYTGLLGELEHLKIETRLIDRMFASVMGEYVFLK